MAYFPSYNKFRTDIIETQSTQSAPGAGGPGLQHRQSYAFSDASWTEGQENNQSGIPCRTGNMPGELFNMLKTASYTSIKSPQVGPYGFRGRYFYNVSPGIINNGGPTSNWNNSRNAIGLDFVGRTSLIFTALPGNNTFYFGGAPNVQTTPSGNISGTGGNTGGGNTGGGNTGGGTPNNTNPNSGTGGFAGAGVAPPSTGGFAGGGY